MPARPLPGRAGRSSGENGTSRSTRVQTSTRADSWGPGARHHLLRGVGLLPARGDHDRREPHQEPVQDHLDHDRAAHVRGRGRGLAGRGQTDHAAARPAVQGEHRPARAALPGVRPAGPVRGDQPRRRRGVPAAGARAPSSRRGPPASSAPSGSARRSSSAGRRPRAGPPRTAHPVARRPKGTPRTTSPAARRARARQTSRGALPVGTTSRCRCSCPRSRARPARWRGRCRAAPGAASDRRRGSAARRRPAPRRGAPSPRASPR